jgi:hypothetical protein
MYLFTKIILYLLQAEYFNESGKACRIASLESYKENVNLDLKSNIHIFWNSYLFLKNVTTMDTINSLEILENHEENDLEEPELSAGSVRQGSTKPKRLSPGATVD